MEKQESDVEVTLETASDDHMVIEIKTTDGSAMRWKQLLSGILGLYTKVAQDAGIEPVAFYMEDQGIPSHITYTDSEVQ